MKVIIDTLIEIIKNKFHTPWICIEPRIQFLPHFIEIRWTYISCLDEQFNILPSVETCHRLVQTLNFFLVLDHLCNIIICFDLSCVMDKFVVDYPHGMKVVNLSYYGTGPTMYSLCYFI